jgi:large subunit ribosomal protein L2
MTVVDYGGLSDVRPLKSLTAKVSKKSGRNSQGRITVRHQGGGNRRLYRLVDFKQQMLNVPAKVETIEYDPFRTAFIARILFTNGKRSYILAPATMKAGDKVLFAPQAPLKDGNRMQLQNILVGYMVHNVELTPGKGGQIVRSAGNFAEILAHDNGYTTLKMPSGEIRKVLWGNYASIGQLSNPENFFVNIGKAGRSRWLGIRPTVRGSAMNPVDHPYGGGEGKAKRGTRRPKTLWGKITGGRKTRDKNKWSNILIVSRRKKK